MKLRFIVTFFSILLCIANLFSFGRKINFDTEWNFIKLPADTTNHEGWEKLDLPHDWSIYGTYSEEYGDWQSGFLPCGIGLYKKVFDKPDDSDGKLVKIIFDGVYRCSDVWINGHHLGYRPNGFIGFEYDMTPYLKAKDNLLEVKVDHSRHLSNRSYTGSGIYRHVWLKIEDKLHIPTWGVNFSSEISGGNKAEYKTTIDIANLYNDNKKCDVVLSFMDVEGKVVSKEKQSVTIAGNDSIAVSFANNIDNIRLWSPENPDLYKLNVDILVAGKLISNHSEKVGFRSIEFDGKKGFVLNGKQTKIKGVCERSTAGALGAAVPDDVLYSRIKKLKNMGCNAIRTSHHPFAPEFYDICDSLGIMVMDEIFDGWETPKAQDDYGLFFEEWWKKDVTDFVKRDRNRACVILWSIGNEVVKPTRETQAKIINLFTELDPTRLTTQGGHDPTRGMEGEEQRTLLGVKGFNGDGEEKGTFERFHAKYPDIPIIGTEVPHTLHTRGVYRTRTHWRKFEFPAVWEQNAKNKVSKEEYLKKMFPIPDLTEKEVFNEELNTKYYQNGKYYPINNNLPNTTYYQSSYDNASVRISARDSWLEVERHDYISGTFRWTGYDYLGESNGWPSRFMNCGVIDICGFPKDHYYLYQSLWSDRPMVHILPHWTHPGKEGIEIPVVAYSNAESVELFLNDKSLGRKENDKKQLVWYVPYKPGEIKAVAYINGNIVSESVQQTAGVPSVVRLSSDKNVIKADNRSVAQIEVSVADNNGIMNPYAENVVRFDVKGGGKIIGVDNGDPLDLSDYKTNVRKAFRGKLMLWVQSDGTERNIEINAFSDNLETGKIIIKTIKQ